MPQITQLQYNTAKQRLRNIRVKINLLNFQYVTIDSFEGNLISGTLTSDANSNLRNSCNIELVVTDSSFNVQNESKIWLDRLIQIYIGVDDIRTGETEWTNKGIYLINQPTYTYDAITNTMSFQGVDLMGRLTGLRGGMLTDSYLIPQDSNVRSAIIACLQENNINRYVVSECENIDGAIQPVPYDMQYDEGQCWSDVLEGLQNILPNYQMYFDMDGVFHYETIPYRSNEPIRMSDDIWKSNVISETVSYDFESVKNSVRVYGKMHDVQHYPSEQVVVATTLKLTISSLTSLQDSVIIGFVAPGDITGPVFIRVNEISTNPLTNENFQQLTQLKKDVYFCAKYNAENAKWVFLGHVQPIGEYKDENPNSPFYIDNPAGEIKISLSGGDYDNIMSDELALARAKWEIWQRCRLNDGLTINTIPIYWAEVNWMVEYTSIGNGQKAQYLISSINTDISPTGTQTYQLVRYYPYYDENEIV